RCIQLFFVLRRRLPICTLFPYTTLFRSFQGPNDVLVDDLFAQSKHAKVGDTIEILNNNFRISGIVAQGKGARKFLPISTLQDLLGAKDKASIFYLKLDNPANADTVVEEIKNVPGME